MFNTATKSNKERDMGDGGVTAIDHLLSATLTLLGATNKDNKGMFPSDATKYNGIIYIRIQRSRLEREMKKIRKKKKQKEEEE